MRQQTREELGSTGGKKSTQVAPKTEFSEVIPDRSSFQSATQEIPDARPHQRGVVNLPNKARRPRAITTEHMHSSTGQPRDLFEPLDKKQTFHICENDGRKNSTYFSKTSKSTNDMRSFRQFYYYPVVDWRSGEVYRMSTDHGEFRPRFLRKSHYMEKMVKEYGLNDYFFLDQETSGFHDRSHASSGEIRVFWLQENFCRFQQVQLSSTSSI